MARARAGHAGAAEASRPLARRHSQAITARCSQHVSTLTQHGLHLRGADFTQAIRRQRRSAPPAVGTRLMYGAPPPSLRPTQPGRFTSNAREPLAPHGPRRLIFRRRGPSPFPGPAGPPSRSVRMRPVRGSSGCSQVLDDEAAPQGTREGDSTWSRGAARHARPCLPRRGRAQRVTRRARGRARMAGVRAPVPRRG